MTTTAKDHKYGLSSYRLPDHLHGAYRIFSSSYGSHTHGQVFLKEGICVGRVTKTDYRDAEGEIIAGWRTGDPFSDDEGRAILLLHHLMADALPDDGQTMQALELVARRTRVLHGSDKPVLTPLATKQTEGSRYARAAVSLQGHHLGELSVLCGLYGKTEIWFTSEPGELGVAVAEVEFQYERDGTGKLLPKDFRVMHDFGHQDHDEWAIDRFHDLWIDYVRKCWGVALTTYALEDAKSGHIHVHQRTNNIMFAERILYDADGYQLGVLRVESARIGDARVYWERSVSAPLLVAP